MFLEVDSLTRRFGGLVAVSKVSFSIAQGEIVGVFGPNGSGKTTLLNVITGVYSPTEGSINWRGESLVGDKPHQIAARGVIKTFQNPQLFRELTVAENALIAGHLQLKNELRARRLGAILPGRIKRDADALIRGRIDDVLKLCRLYDTRDELAANLSYGGEKMLGVAMAMMCAPKLLLLDEPGSGLGKDELSNLDQVLRGLREHGTTLCVIDHRVGFLGKLADRAIVLHHGAKIADGKPADVLADAAVVAAYLGTAHA